MVGVDVEVANGVVMKVPVVDTVGPMLGVEAETSVGSKLDSGTMAITRS